MGFKQGNCPQLPSTPSPVLREEEPRSSAPNPRFRWRRGRSETCSDNSEHLALDNAKVAAKAAPANKHKDVEMNFGLQPEGLRP